MRTRGGRLMHAMLRLTARAVKYFVRFDGPSPRRAQPGRQEREWYDSGSEDTPCFPAFSGHV